MGLRTYQDTMKKYKENEDMRNRLAGTSESTEPSEEELIADLANYATKVEPNVAKINQSVEKLTPNGNSPVNSLEDLLTRYNSFKTGGQPLNMTPVNATADVIPPVDTKPKTLDILKKVKELKNPTINNSKDLLSNKFVPTTEQDYQKVGDEGFEDLANPKLQPTEYDKPNAMAGEIDKNQIADAGLKSKVTSGPDTRDEDKVIPEAPAKPLTLEEQLEKAQQDKRWMDALALINRGFTTMGAGMGGGSVTQLKPDQTTSEMLGKMGEERVQQAKDKITATQAANKASQEERYKLMQQDKMKKEMEYLDAKMKGTLPEDPNTKARLEMWRQSNDMRKEELSRKWANDREDDMTKQVDKFNKHKVVEAAQKMAGDAISAREMAMSSNPLANNAIPTFLSRASGEVGALTEADKAPFGGSQALDARLKQAVQQAAAGTLTKENKQLVVDLANTFDKVSKLKMEQVAERQASQYGGINFDRNTLKNRLLGMSGDERLDTGFDPKNPNASFQTKQNTLETYQKNKQLKSIPTGETKVLGGKTYRKVGENQWEPI